MKSSRRDFLAAGVALPALSLTDTRKPEAGSGPFRYRRLGRTGLELTTVGFGCMITSDASVIEKAADLGINYFDTARGYQSGNNERMVGAALKTKRKQLHISTKTHAGTKEAALADLDTSLRELGTDYVDIWYLHAKTNAGQLTPELIEAQQIAKKAGKIRFTGFSTHGGHESVMPAGVKSGQFDVILLSYNFSMDPAIGRLIEEAKAADVGLVAMKVMAGGFRRSRDNERLRGVLEREGAFVSALKWVLKNPAIATTIPSITDMDQLDEDFKAMPAAFGPADEKTLTAQLDYIRPLYCRSCGRCSGVCPRGVPVSDTLRVLSYAEGYGQFALARERFRELASADCGDCVSCQVRCPNGVRVAERVRRAQELFA